MFVDCFHILNHASTIFQLKIKEAFHIQREQPSLNQQLCTPFKSKIILIILTLSRFMFILLSPFIINSIFVYLL